VSDGAALGVVSAGEVCDGEVCDGEVCDGLDSCGEFWAGVPEEGDGDGVKVAALAGATTPTAPRRAALAMPTTIRAPTSSPDDPLGRTGGDTSDENTRIPPHFRWRAPLLSNSRAGFTAY